MCVKHIVVVGASSSFGQVLVPVLEQSNHKITSTYYRHKPLHFSSTVTLEYLDISSEDSQNTFSATTDSIDALILLPGILPGVGLEQYNDELSETVMNINFTFQANLIRRLLSKFSDDSQILILSSISGQKGSFDPFYAASKSALFGFGKSIAISLAPRTRVNIVAPSLILDSAMYLGMTSDRRKFHIDQSTRKRLLTAEELALVMVDLLKPNWAHLNGAIIGLNGGSYL